MVENEDSGLLRNPNKSTMSPREAAEQRWGTMIAQRYRVEELLSFDDMGALYRARDTERGVPCALRILPEIYAQDPAIRDRFLRDAEAAQVLKHPNIVEVFETGKLEDGGVFSVMQLLDGQNLRQVIEEERRISPGRAVHIASQVCRALGTAHEVGIIHRDLKSSSIMLVTQDGELDVVKVLDFGVCSHVDSETSGVTAADKLVGSTDYMAPEQAAGEEADPVSDIYALGTILFEMLTGELPYKGRNAYDLMMKKGREEAPRVEEIVRDVPLALSELVARCLAPRPENRVRSMRVLEVELLRSLDAPPPPNRTASHPPVVGRVMAVDPDMPERAASSASTSSGALAQPTEPAAASASHPQTVASASISAPRVVEHRVVETVAHDPHSNAWLWLVAAGTLAVVLVLFGPQMFASSPPPPPPPPQTEPADEVEEPPPPPPPQTPTKPEELKKPVKVENAVDPLVVAGRADLALSEGRFCEPAGECLRDYLAALRELDPNHEALARLTKAMPAAALEAGKKATAEKRYSDAGSVYRCVLALAPETPNVKQLLADALVGEGKILRLMKSWDELVPLLEEYDSLGIKPGLDALVLKGHAMAGKGRWQEAVDALSAAAKLKSSDAEIRKALEAAKKELKAAAAKK